MKNAWSGIIYLPLNYLIFDCNATHATSLSNQWNLTLLIECVYFKTYKIPIQIHLNIVNKPANISAFRIFGGNES